ncbi:hypothetical protein FF011L_17390 [Roseimaritima multifibrata]|uniref:Pseudopilin GspJ n=1 Tax=Roseimaritima multifibrata TaxID=1930274 RepID=A0A517MDM0_9BACT|nr:hypothetical protein [Roseimaritima multifibrata]QDS92984.1 hypothetical protein FF011L_17390 [Roseimaritima multifibrata]
MIFRNATSSQPKCRVNRLNKRLAGRSKFPGKRPAFTLLEMILTLSLAVILTALVGGALSFYGNNMETRDQEVRRVQLATAIMKMIGDDLKATLIIEEFDASALASALASTGMDAASGGGEGEAESTESGSALLDIDEDSMGTGEEVSDDLATEAVMLQRPGLMGNQYQIMFDISRTPRLEDFQQVAQDVSEGLMDIPSDLKTVTYYVQQEGTTGVQDPLTQISEGLSIGSPNSGGLVRRAVDRLVTRYAMDSGNVTGLNMTGDLLAPEVLQIQFAYWDGFMWQIEWNSDEMGELPMAVQVRLTLGKRGVDSTVVDPTSSDQVRVFQQIVRLPMGRLVEEDEFEDDGMSGVGL